jgi:hypothetical protein
MVNYIFEDNIIKKDSQFVVMFSIFINFILNDIITIYLIIALLLLYYFS